MPPRNFIIANEFVSDWDRTDLFPDDEEVLIIRQDANKDMFDILVMAECFSSKGQARKSWTKTGAEIPKGWSEFFVGKLKKHLAIWNPWIGPEEEKAS